MAEIPSLAIPISTDAEGVIRVGGTRVTLDVIVARHLQGDAPESIHEGFPTLSLSDIYAVIAYYLAHEDEFDAYLQRREREADQLRREVEAGYSPEAAARTDYFRERLASKRSGTAS